jgi:competence protein ComEC
MNLKKLAVPLIALALILFSSGCDLPGPWNTGTSTPQRPISPAATPPATTTSTIAPVGNLVVSFLDVGQGDAEIVQVNGQAMLIDAGTNASTAALVGDIKALGLTRFDVVVGTHPHEDHIGGMDAVINQFGIGTIYMPKVTTTTKTFSDVLTAIKNKGLSITTPTVGSTFTLGSAQCTILAPSNPSSNDLNNASIVIKLTYGTTSFLFTGDAQTESEQAMLLGAFSLKADVLKVGHHGSSTSTSPAFLNAVSPKYAVIEVGAGNDYGHPHQGTLDKLGSAGVKVYRTDLNGTVTATSDGSAISFGIQR